MTHRRQPFVVYWRYHFIRSKRARWAMVKDYFRSIWSCGSIPAPTLEEHGVVVEIR